MVEGLRKKVNAFQIATSEPKTRKAENPADSTDDLSSFAFDNLSSFAFLVKFYTDGALI